MISFNLAFAKAEQKEYQSIIIDLSTLQGLTRLKFS